MEVFPQAIVRRLGVGGGHKTTRAGYREQLNAAALIAGEAPDELDRDLARACYGSRHDRLDAYMSAWVASVPASELEACGMPPDDVIWLPKRPGALN